MAEGRTSARRGTDGRAKPILAVTAGIVLIWFILANTQEVQVTWLVVDTSTSLIVVIIVSALLGAGVSYFLTRVRRLGGRDESRHRDPAGRGGTERPR
jgi:uncharacterized integral membrane protein